MAIIHMTALALVLAVSVSADQALHPLSDAFIEHLNAQPGLWTAGRNFPADTPMAQIRILMGTLPDDNLHNLPKVFHDADVIANLPESFDPRQKWPNCPSLNEIRDQGQCGSCWAFAAVETMTDRICIHSNGATKFHFSAQDLLACCSYCSRDCKSGGIPSAAWKFWHQEGIVSGGGYNSHQGCQPYTVRPSSKFYHNSSENATPIRQDEKPKCEHTCRSGYPVKYRNDKHFGKNGYSVDNNEEQIKGELFKNGPVQATMTVYADFMTYKHGVYRHKSGAKHGQHSIKIIGWGVEGGAKYWLCANSWNTSFGEQGFFKIVRGENHCGIEEAVLAGEPLKS